MGAREGEAGEGEGKQQDWGEGAIAERTESRQDRTGSRGR